MANKSNAQPETASDLYQAVKQMGETGPYFQIRGDDENFFLAVCCAVRYCLGRRTYMPDLITRWIRGNLNGVIPIKYIDLMLRDISTQRSYGDRALGDACDVATWNRFEKWLEEQKSKDE